MRRDQSVDLTALERARRLAEAWRKNGVKISESEVDSLALVLDDVRHISAVYYWLVGFTCGIVVTVVLSGVAWLIWR